MKDERKKLWLKAHIIYQERLKIKEARELITYMTRRFLFVVASVLGAMLIYKII